MRLWKSLYERRLDGRFSFYPPVSLQRRDSHGEITFGRAPFGHDFRIPRIPNRNIKTPRFLSAAFQGPFLPNGSPISFEKCPYYRGPHSLSRTFSARRP